MLLAAPLFDCYSRKLHFRGHASKTLHRERPFFDFGFTGWNVQPFDREVAVRFQTNEAVAVQDREVVLRALETCLRGVSNEVVRYGDKITLHGLGPSPKAVNYQDTTVLSVSAENDKTIINADVSFQ